jgi:antitoxin MazE
MRVAKWDGNIVAGLPKRLAEELGQEAGDEFARPEASKERLIAEKSARGREAVARMGARAWPLPEEYRFDREEANER